MVPGSPPTRGRGLKQPENACRCIRGLVAPHAGAWVETALISARQPGALVAPHAGAWVETARKCMPLYQGAGRPPRGGVG